MLPMLVETLFRLDETFTTDVCVLEAAVETTETLASTIDSALDTPPRLVETFPKLLLMAT